jgi:hypothetical protein
MNTIKKAKEVNIGNIGELIITKDLQKIIDYLHFKVKNTEWSGVLFYKLIEGDIKDLKNLKFKADFMYPMNIGNAAFTSFEYTGDLMNAYDVYEDGMESTMGLIHTHHSMSKFNL